MSASININLLRYYRFRAVKEVREVCVGVLWSIDDEIRVRHVSSGHPTFTSQQPAQRLHTVSLFTVNASESDILFHSVLKLKIN